jgi:DNA-binding PadR family transcriptional regulator
MPIDSTTNLRYNVAVSNVTMYRMTGGDFINGLTEILKGVLEGFILEIIGQGEIYGYLILKRLKEIGLEDVVDGTVYTVLLRIEKNNLVNVKKKASDLGPPRKYYTLSEKGQNELAEFWEKWAFISTKAIQLKEVSHD